MNIDQLTDKCATLIQTVLRRYWTSVAMLTVVNTCLLGATSAIAGLSVSSFTTGAREVVLINVMALTLLVWPTMALTVRGLYARRKWCCWGAATHAAAVFILMEAYFGKPFGLASESTIANLIPTVLFMGLSAWLLVEWRTLRAPQPAIQSAASN